MFTEIWNNAYQIYCDGDYGLMWDYLREQVNNRNILYDDAQTIAEDVVDTYNLWRETEYGKNGKYYWI